MSRKTLSGMPISVIRERRFGSSTIEWRYTDVVDVKPHRETMGKAVALMPGQSKWAIEVIVMVGAMGITTIAPIRLTNVDGHLVRSLFRRPRPRSV